MRNYERNSAVKPAKPWQLRWWREDPERWRWAGAIAIVFLLMGAFAYQNPHIWMAPAPLEQAANDENTADEAITDTAIANERIIAEQSEPLTAIPEPPQDGDAPDSAPITPMPAEQATLPEPEGPEDEVMAVSAPPVSWQQPGFGIWTRDYGYSLDPTCNDYRFHHGRDMDMEPGAPVFAAAAGHVVLATDDQLWGGIVIIEHGGGWRSVYKCVQPEVKPGLEIAAGEQLGVVLASPPAEKAQNSHLHFEMSVDETSQNPAQWL